jgi:predicted nucleotidyltransferase
METAVEKIEMVEENLSAFERNPLRPLIEKMAARIAEKYRPEQIILYGSQATGKARPASDIDFFIIKQTQESFITRCATVKMLLRDLRGKIPVFPIVLTPKEVERRLERGDQFIEQIIERGIKLL